MDLSRQRLLHEHNTEGGSIADEMKSYSLQPVENDGLHLYGNTRVNPITSGPFSSNQEIEIPLTTTNFDVCEFINSYIHLKTRISLRCNNPPVSTDHHDAAFERVMGDNQFVFVGLKASPHLIRDYQFKFNNIPITTTMQSS